VLQVHKEDTQTNLADLQKFYMRIDARSCWAQSCTTSECPRFPPFDPFEMVRYLLREYNSWATMSRSMFHFVMFSGVRDNSTKSGLRGLFNKGCSVYCKLAGTVL
jgi:hypothetical protein